MDVREAIGKRRSVRFYSEDPVTENTIHELLDAARLAPSGCNAQPWRFLVVRERDTVQELKRQKAFPQNFVYEAPVIIVCCGDPDAYLGRYGGENQVADGSVPEDPDAQRALFKSVEGKNAARTLRDVAIASAFLVLRATELGLATSYVGLIDEAVLHTVLAIPERLVIPFIITAGYERRSRARETAQNNASIRTPRKEIADILLGLDPQIPARKTDSQSL